MNKLTSKDLVDNLKKIQDNNVATAESCVKLTEILQEEEKKNRICSIIKTCILGFFATVAIIGTVWVVSAFMTIDEKTYQDNSIYNEQYNIDGDYNKNIYTERKDN